MEQITRFSPGMEDAGLEYFLSLLNRHAYANRIARVERSGKVIGGESPQIEGNLSIYQKLKVVTWKGVIINLSYSQYNLISILVDFQGQYISEDALIGKLIVYNYSDNPKLVLRDLIFGAQRKFRVVDFNFDSLSHSPKLGCAWEYLERKDIELAQS